MCIAQVKGAVYPVASGRVIFFFFFFLSVGRATHARGRYTRSRASSAHGRGDDSAVPADGSTPGKRAEQPAAVAPHRYTTIRVPTHPPARTNPIDIRAVCRQHPAARGPADDQTAAAAAARPLCRGNVLIHCIRAHHNTRGISTNFFFSSFIFLYVIFSHSIFSRTPVFSADFSYVNIIYRRRSSLTPLWPKGRASV